MQKNVVVIGGGIIGLSTAWKLAKNGHQVTLLEKGKCGDGSTCASLGALVPYNPWREDDVPTKQRDSLWKYPSFANELMEDSGIDMGYNRCGRLQIIQSEDQYNRLKDGTDIANKLWPKIDGKDPQQILSPQELKTIEPELEPTAFGALLCRATAQLNPQRTIAALRAACMRHNVDLREDSPAIEIVTSENKVTSVRSATGMIIADHVVLAAGAWSKALLPKQAMQEKYVAPLKGQSIEVTLENNPIKHLIRGLSVYIMPVTGTNKIWIGGTKEKNAGFDESLTPEAEEMLLQKAETLMPILAESKILKQWAGFRPYSEQGSPIIGWDETVEGLYHATGHAGIGLCLTPYTSNKVMEDFA